MPQPRKPFARRLQQLREVAGISQYELAKRSGVSKQAVSNLELGNREPSWETVRRLARALGVSVAAFDDPDEDLDLPPPKRRSPK